MLLKVGDLAKRCGGSIWPSGTVSGTLQPALPQNGRRRPSRPFQPPGASTAGPPSKVLRRSVRGKCDSVEFAHRIFRQRNRRCAKILAQVAD